MKQFLLYAPIFQFNLFYPFFMEVLARMFSKKCVLLEWSCKRSNVNWMAAGLRLQVQSRIFSFFTYFSNILCAVKFKVLGLKAY